MSHDTCSTCGDSLEDAEFCVISECPHKPRGATQPALGTTGRGVLTLPKAALSRRVGGSGLEFVTLFALEIMGSILLPIGLLVSLLGAVYFGVKDLGGGRYSVGKRIASTRVVDAKTGEVPSSGRLALRNSYFVLGWVMAIIPGFEVLGWLFLMGVASVDALMVVADPRGRRIGDRLAGTQVVPVSQG